MRRRRHHIGVRDRARVHPAGDQPGDVRHVDHEHRADLARDRGEGLEVDDPRVGARPRDDQLRPVPQREGPDLVVVDSAVLLPDPVRADLEDAAADVDRRTMRQVAAVGEAHPEDPVARIEESEVRRHVGLRTRVRLYVRVLRAEELLAPRDRQLLGHVDPFAAAVVAAPRVPLGILVRQDRPLRLQHGARGEVLAGDQLQRVVLAIRLATDRLVDLGVGLPQLTHSVPFHSLSGAPPSRDPAQTQVRWIFATCSIRRSAKRSAASCVGIPCSFARSKSCPSVS